ncbi:MAG: hypothetical protein V4489_09255 [Chlamydiota bacterium]
MKKMFIAMALLSIGIVSAQATEVKNIVEEVPHLTCNCPGHDVNTTEEQAIEEKEDPSLACSECDKDRGGRS